MGLQADHIFCGIAKGHRANLVIVCVRVCVCWGDVLLKLASYLGISGVFAF